MSTASPSPSVAESLARESRQKRRRIASSLWPRARLIGEILWHQTQRDHVFTQAAALTYKTLFSLLPILVLTLLILSTISSDDGKSAFDSAVKNMLFEQTGFDRMMVPIHEPTPVARTQAENAAASTQEAATQESSQERVTQVTIASVLEPLIEKAKHSVNGRLTGLVAFGILLYGAISLMFVIESTFNQIYGAIKPRSWPRRIMLYWCVLTLGPVGIAASITLGNSAYHAAATVAGAGRLMTQVMSCLNVFSGFMVSWLLILMMYRIIPDTRVQWRPLVVGSFLAAIAWEVGKWAFGLYVQRAVRNNWYGSLALLPLFMFWLYITWSVVLVGLEITYVQQFWPMLKRRFFFTRAGSEHGPGAGILSDVRWVLSLGALLYRQFRAGKVTDVAEAAELLMIPNDVTGMLLDSLQQAGLVHEVREDCYTLARPPENITAHDLLTAARALCQVPPELAREAAHVATYPTSESVRKLEELEAGWAKANTLLDLASDESPSRPGAGDRTP